MKINCRYYYEQEKTKLTTRLLKPCLGIMQIGVGSASNSYVKGIINDCKDIGIEYKIFKIKDSSNIDLISTASVCFNTDNNINGVIVVHDNHNIDYNKILIKEDKIIDKNCTCDGVFHLLELMNTNLEGKTIMLIGKGKVGKAIFNKLSDVRATVISCNSTTKGELIDNLVQCCDIVISTVGRENLLDGNLFKDNQIVIDVGVVQGINGLCGDIDKSTYDKMDDNNVLYTSVPNGIGLMTRISLFKNLFEKGGLE